MNDGDSSRASDGTEQSGATQAATAVRRTAASALLSAAEIWSSDKALTPAAGKKPLRATAPAQVGEQTEITEEVVLQRALRPSELLAESRFFTSGAKRARNSHAEPAREAKIGPAPAPVGSTALASTSKENPTEALIWPPKRLSLALQGGGSFGAFTWGVLERLLEEPACSFEAISGASVGALNAVLLACGLAEGGREGARRRLAQFWNRIINECSFRSLMLIGGFSPAGTSVSFGPTLRSAQFDPLDLDPLREVLATDVDFSALRALSCPKLLIAATRVRDGQLKIFTNDQLTADVLLASTCPPLVHCAVEIDGESYWDGSFAANPPVVDLARESRGADLLVVQVTPAHDKYIPVTMAAVDRRLDQIMGNAVLNAEIAGLALARKETSPPHIFRIAAEDEIDGLAQRSAVDLGQSFVSLLHGRGRAAAERWLRQGLQSQSLPCAAEPRETVSVALKLQRLLEEAGNA
jgi:NTE family protein